MIRINLLPFRAARKKENIRRQISIFLLLLILIIIAAVAFNFTLNNKAKKLNAKVDNTRNELAKYNKINKEIAEIKQKLDILNKKVGVVQALEINRKEPILLLDTMTKMVIEKRMWFKSFTVKGSLVNIKGVALDNETVADFMRRLEGSKLFSSVDLKTLKQQKIRIANMNLMSFEVSCNRVLNKMSGRKKPASIKTEK